MSHFSQLPIPVLWTHGYLIRDYTCRSVSSTYKPVPGLTNLLYCLYKLHSSLQSAVDAPDLAAMVPALDSAFPTSHPPPNGSSCPRQRHQQVNPLAQTPNLLLVSSTSPPTATSTASRTYTTYIRRSPTGMLKNVCTWIPNSPHTQLRRPL